MSGNAGQQQTIDIFGHKFTGNPDEDQNFNLLREMATFIDSSLPKPVDLFVPPPLSRGEGGEDDEETPVTVVADCYFCTKKAECVHRFRCCRKVIICRRCEHNKIHLQQVVRETMVLCPLIPITSPPGVSHALVEIKDNKMIVSDFDAVLRLGVLALSLVHWVILITFVFLSLATGMEDQVTYPVFFRGVAPLLLCLRIVGLLGIFGELAVVIYYTATGRKNNDYVTRSPFSGAITTFLVVLAGLSDFVNFFGIRMGWDRWMCLYSAVFAWSLMSIIDYRNWTRLSRAAVLDANNKDLLSWGIQITPYTLLYVYLDFNVVSCLMTAISPARGDAVGLLPPRMLYVLVISIFVGLKGIVFDAFLSSNVVWCFITSQVFLEAMAYQFHDETPKSVWITSLNWHIILFIASLMLGYVWRNRGMVTGGEAVKSKKE